VLRVHLVRVCGCSCIWKFVHYRQGEVSPLFQIGGRLPPRVGHGHEAQEAEGIGDIPNTGLRCTPSVDAGEGYKGHVLSLDCRTDGPLCSYWDARCGEQFELLNGVLCYRPEILARPDWYVLL
jgi:hypothetical protein